MQVPCEAATEVAGQLSATACRLKFAALERANKEANKPSLTTSPAKPIVPAASDKIVSPDAPQTSIEPPTACESRSSVASSLASPPSSALPADTPISAAVPTDLVHVSSAVSPSRASEPAVGADSSPVAAASPSDAPARPPPPVKPVAELLTSFDAPLYRNYVKAPVLPAMAVRGCCLL